MPYVVKSGGWAGSWGRGTTERQARAEWRKHGGGGECIVFRIHDAYVDPYVDDMGAVWAERGPLVEHVERKACPPVIAECWKVSENGRSRVAIDPKTGEKVTP